MKSLSLEEISNMVMEQARIKGFGVDLQDVNIPEKFALIHTEVSEAFEAYRKKDTDGEHGTAIELGDALQRILHLARLLDIDIEKAVLRKLSNNKDRIWDWENLNEKGPGKKI